MTEKQKQLRIPRRFAARDDKQKSRFVMTKPYYPTQAKGRLG
jgi:hypothetical protein